MPSAARELTIAELRERISALEGGVAKRRECLPFGTPAIDAVLPAGGLAHGALHEIAGGGSGTVDGAAAALFAAGDTRSGKRKRELRALGDGLVDSISLEPFDVPVGVGNQNGKPDRVAQILSASSRPVGNLKSRRPTHLTRRGHH